jgi:GlpG protein
MRLIGYIESAERAQKFTDFLYAQGVKNQADRTTGDRWEIWVLSEEQVEIGKQHLSAFQANPDGLVFQEAAALAKEIRKQESREQEAYAERTKDGRDLNNPGPNISTGRLTLILMIICGIIFLFQKLDFEVAIFQKLSISNFKAAGGSIGLPEIRRGEIWRLITPIFMHGDIFHIFFNLMWMRILGTIIEYRQGWKKMLTIVLATASFSNLAQYYVSGPLFLGISGVVFGLLGYIWMKGKFDPFAGMFLPQGVVFMMLFWLLLGISGALEASLGVGVANTAHIGGLASGCLMGYANSWTSKIKRR